MAMIYHVNWKRMESLPEELVSFILSHLPDVDAVLNALLVCRAWYTFLSRSEPWTLARTDSHASLVNSVVWQFPTSRLEALISCHNITVYLCPSSDRLHRLAHNVSEGSFRASSISWNTKSIFPLVPNCPIVHFALDEPGQHAYITLSNAPVVLKVDLEAYEAKKRSLGQKSALWNGQISRGYCFDDKLDHSSVTMQSWYNSSLGTSVTPHGVYSIYKDSLYLLDEDNGAVSENNVLRTPRCIWREVENNVLVSGFFLPYDPNQLFVNSLDPSGHEVISFADVPTRETLSTQTIPDFVNGLTVKDGLMYVTEGPQRLWLWDIREPKVHSLWDLNVTDLSKTLLKSPADENLLATSHNEMILFWDRRKPSRYVSEWKRPTIPVIDTTVWTKYGIWTVGSPDWADFAQQRDVYFVDPQTAKTSKYLHFDNMVMQIGATDNGKLAVYQDRRNKTWLEKDCKLRCAKEEFQVMEKLKSWLCSRGLLKSDVTTIFKI